VNAAPILGIVDILFFFIKHVVSETESISVIMRKTGKFLLIFPSSIPVIVNAYLKGAQLTRKLSFFRLILEKDPV
jgi:hypothetical protein